MVGQNGWAQVPGDSVESLHAKLQGLSADLTNWEHTHFGSVRQEIDQLKRQLQILRQIPGRTGPGHAELNVTDRMVELFHREEILWRQRARLDWLGEMDKTGPYLKVQHKMAPI